MSSASYNSPRRREAAAQTRQAILDAARRLFAERGYAATTIQEIAAAARVATATVYASVGGKPRLLDELVSSAAGDTRLQEAADRVTTAANPGEVLRGCVAAARFGAQEYADIFELMLTTKHTDEGTAAAAAGAAQGFRGGLGLVATRLRDLGALPGTTGDAVDVLAYFLGYPSWRRLVDDFGWSYPRAETWLVSRIAEALRIDLLGDARQTEASGPAQ
ncbi:Transcriptional regulator [Amycolatopsis camponoti]|uniref:Transcriptional regulator n=1 Tax=Amycolatopsis camponoti TaxID=2606593 RepID=A0A6I8LM02_9PSEU|nr:TetR/AcrR family transcriptional regulator [Amycolatopsis camponoti]VVJ17418.1 Transcriptional regulator [Amycolatopsis camponoti]